MRARLTRTCAHTLVYAYHKIKKISTICAKMPKFYIKHHFLTFFSQSLFATCMSSPTTSVSSPHDVSVVPPTTPMSPLFKLFKLLILNYRKNITRAHARGIFFVCFVRYLKNEFFVLLFCYE